ncbi:MAG TPA: CheR family methyltransferase [Bacteriovoracaceae bacterium]|nr:CheR family methyltransferase [Bacteriovoracaceae bacterium]
MDNNELLAFFSKYIERELGIIYSEHNLYQLQNRLEEVIKTLNIPDVSTLYQDVVSNNPRFKKQILLDIATNNETTFFRDTRVFAGIEKLLKNFIKDCETRKEDLKIWSAASSTGQEAVSISMLLEESLEVKHYSIDYSILCTDISERVLKRARAGVFTELEVSRGLPSHFLHKYFKSENSQWRFNPRIMRKMDFRNQNIKESFAHLGKFHIILCRNVLIYQNVEGKIEILKRLASSLHPGGYLILGAGESLLGLTNDFEQEIIDGAVFYKRAAPI